MKIKNIFSSSYIGWIVIFAALIFWFFFYFMSYIPHQEAQLNKRGFRILREFSSNMLEKHEYYQNHFINFAQFYYLRDSGWVTALDDKKQKAVKITIDALDPSIKRSREKETTLFKKNKGESSFYFNQDSASETFIVPVETFMRGMKFDRLFESIVLFDNDEVYYNSESEIAYNITNPKAILDSVKNQQGGFVKLLEVTGEKKRALIIPFDIAGKKLYLGGIIAEDDFQNKTRSINFQLLILISGLLLVLLVGMPVLKILLIDAYDHLDASDPHRVVISFIVATGVLVLISVGSTYHKVIDRKNQQKRLVQISDSIYSNIENDLNALSLFSDNIIKKDELKVENAGSILSNSVFPKINTDTIFDLNELILMDSLGTAEVVYSVSESINFSIKTTLNSTPIEKLDLSSRLYFKNIKDTSKSWHNNLINRFFYLQSITSYNTGQRETALSFSVAPKVFAITSPIPSFFNHIIPDDTEFAVIDSKGEVLFHSQESKNLHENFLDECESSPTLKSAVELRTAETGRITYNEKPWLFRSVPLEDTPLTLVTLLDIKQMQQRNTRIILFTFYFFVVTLICILIWMLLLRAIRPGDKYVTTQSWLFDWLHFNEKNYADYKQFFAILLVLILSQLLGGFMINEPVTMLIYQLVFILLSGIAGLVVLGNFKFNVKEFYRKKQLPSTVLLILLIGLIVLLLCLQWELFIIMIVPILIARYIYFLMYNEENPLITKIQHQFRLDKTSDRKERWIRNSYNFSLILWLVSLSFLPTVQYYFTIEHQEEEIWRKQQMIQLAQKSLNLANESDYGLKHIRFSGFSDLTLKYRKERLAQPASFQIAESQPDATTRIYNLLSDPLTEIYKGTALIRDSSYHFEWMMSTNLDSLTYANPAFAGWVSVKNDGFGKRNGFLWLFLLIPAAAVLVFLWFVLSYAGEFVFYTKQSKWQVENNFSIEKLVATGGKKRILINTFNEKVLRDRIEEEIQKKSAQTGLEIISANSLIQSNTKIGSAGSNTIVYITDLDQCIQRFEKHQLLLERLGEINFNAEGNVLIPVPFEPEFIGEAIDDFISINKPDDDVKSDLYQIKLRWSNVMSHYEQIYYSGLEVEKPDDVKLEHSQKKLFYAFIWNNLCRFEKLVLYDLTHDGLINLKNEKMIYRLMQKGLIKYDKYLLPFSSGFKYYVNNSIHPAEKKNLEQSSNLKGMWHTMRYPIIIVVVIIAVFVFISQGYSIEKVTAIFAGILTLMATMTKLFNGG